MNHTLSGAREAGPSFFRRLVARAQARELVAFVVPGTEVARAYGLDVEAAGLRLSDTPRHASVLLMVGELPEGLKEAAAVAYAQMPRPRVVVAVGTADVSPLPGPDVSVPLGQEALVGAVAGARTLLAEGAFAPEAPDFDVDAIRTETEYTCSMHPEIVQDEPGSCPKCGMDLVPRESTGGDGPANHGDMAHGDMDHGEHPEHGGPEPQEETSGETTGAAGYTCPMHPEVVRDEPGSCPVCGMDLVPQEDGGEDKNHGEEAADHDGASASHGADKHESGNDADHGGGEHGGMDHGDMDFMSMIEMTKDLPRSSDGLQMEWVEETPFGPLFPGLPAGLSLSLTLDGDTVARAEAGSVVADLVVGEFVGATVEEFVDRLGRLDPLAPVSYRLLALRAIEDAAGVEVDGRTAQVRVGILERERAASHLSWLAGFGHLLGYAWLEKTAGRLQLALLRARNPEELLRLRDEAGNMVRRIQRTPLLRRRLVGVGVLPDGMQAVGPVACATGAAVDARSEEEAYRELGFDPVIEAGGDALARLRVRLAEVRRSLHLARKAGAEVAPDPAPDPAPGPAPDSFSGTGAATVETPRGAATLTLTLEDGRVDAAELETPSTQHLGLVESITEQRELADALLGVASLDLSPWEVIR